MSNRSDPKPRFSQAQNNKMAAEAARRSARRFAMQGLYEWQMTHNPAFSIESRTRAENAMHKVDLAYYHDLLSDIIAHNEAIDESLQQLLDRQISELDGVERAILRIGLYEMQQRFEVPYIQVIEEAITLAKNFGATDSFHYVNGVLDRAARQYRAEEVAAYHTYKNSQAASKAAATSTEDGHDINV